MRRRGGGGEAEKGRVFVIRVMVAFPRLTHQETLLKSGMFGCLLIPKGFKIHSYVNGDKINRGLGIHFFLHSTKPEGSKGGILLFNGLSFIYFIYLFFLLLWMAACA